MITFPVSFGKILHLYKHVRTTSMLHLHLFYAVSMMCVFCYVMSCTCLCMFVSMHSSHVKSSPDRIIDLILYHFRLHVRDATVLSRALHILFVFWLVKQRSSNVTVS